ncbi:MAG: YdeI/OmpD-associated family protein [Fimbriimonas sp.]
MTQTIQIEVWSEREGVTGFRIPAEVVENFAAGKRPKVKVTIDGHTYRSTISVYGGQFMLPLSAENRNAAGVAAGQTIDLTLELDTEERVVEVPEDLRDALETAGLIERFAKLAFTHQKEHVRAILEAKAEATRARRIARAIEMLQQ